MWVARPPPWSALTGVSSAGQGTGWAVEGVSGAPHAAFELLSLGQSPEHEGRTASANGGVHPRRRGCSDRASIDGCSDAETRARATRRPARDGRPRTRSRGRARPRRLRTGAGSCTRSRSSRLVRARRLLKPIVTWRRPESTYPYSLAAVAQQGVRRRRLSVRRRRRGRESRCWGRLSASGAPS